MKGITAEELDRRFDDGESLEEYIVPGSTRRVYERIKIKRVNIDLPVSVINALDKESKRIGVTRQALIKFWIDERLRQIDPAAQ